MKAEELRSTLLSNEFRMKLKTNAENAKVQREVSQISS
jgi:hypothetical protein